MTLLSRTRTARLAIGGIAAALGLGAVVPQVVEASAEPASTDHIGSVDPASIPAPGTYQSCTGMFGLYKNNSDLASFDIVQGSNPVANLPVMGTDIVPIVTLSDGVTEYSCEAVPGWIDEATFTSDFLSWVQYSVGTTMPYPGTGYYLLPTIDGEALTVNGSVSFTPTSRTIEFPNELDGDSTLSWLPTQPGSIDVDYMPWTTPGSSTALTQAFFTRLFDAVVNAPGGGQAQADYLEAQLTLLYDSQQSTCNDSDATLVALVQTLVSLSGDFAPYMQAQDCNTLSRGAMVVGIIEAFGAQVSDTVITMSVSGPAPTTTSTSTTMPSTTVAGTDPVIPAFTG